MEPDYAFNRNNSRTTEINMSNKNSGGIENPKLHPDPASNTEKDPDEWVSGDEPMTGAQASYLKTLSEQAGDPHAFDTSLTKAEASKRIDALKARASGTRK
jgi:Protein of unknown function (DUF3072)